jgi:hypothetical protein
MKEICGCCEGIEKAVPLSTANRPYLNALTYRVGTHATFLETMVAGLTDHYLDIAQEKGETKRICPLQSLRVHSSDDPSIAMLDAWATVADVLTFYQERIANEGYLRTATERRSILELAKLVGYNLRPGVSASVFLAFDLEKGYDLTIDPGMRVQSLPGPGELPQSFETGEPLEGRANWNRLQVRTTKPQYVTKGNADPQISGNKAIDKVFLSGISASLNPNDPLLMVFDPISPDAVFRQVESVELQPAKNRTLVMLQTPDGEARLEAPSISLDDLLDPLSKPASRPPATPRRLGRSIEKSFDSASDIGPQLLTTLNPALKYNLYPAWESAKVVEDSKMKSLDALRVKARPFGHNAPLKPIYDGKCVPIGYEEWPLTETATASVSIPVSQLAAVSSMLLAERAAASTSGTPVLFSVKRGAQVQSKLVQMSVGMLLTNPTIKLGDENVKIVLTPGIRFMNRLMGPSSVDVYANGIKVLEKIKFGDLEKINDLESALTPPIDGKKLKLQITESGKPIENSLIAQDVVFDEGKAFTVVALGRAAKGSLTVLADELPSSKDKVTIHIVHASPGTGRVNFSIVDTLSGNVAASAKNISLGDAGAVITSPGKTCWSIDDAKTPNKNLFNNCLGILGAGEIHIIFLTATSETDQTPAAINANVSDQTRLLPKSVLVLDFTALKRKFKFSLEKGATGLLSVNAQVLSGDAVILKESLDIREILERSIEGHRIRMEFSPNYLISDESPISLSPDLRRVISLESQHDEILPGSLVVIEQAKTSPLDGVKRTIARVQDVQTVSKKDFGITGDVTQLILDTDWLTDSDTTLASIRNTVVYAQNEALDLADEEIDPIDGAVCGDTIELEGIYDGLKSGRWLIVSGERTDVPGTSGVTATELAMLASVTQGVQNLPEDSEGNQPPLPGDKTHTFLKLAEKLAYCYKLDAVTIYANVTKATHGETRSEILGSGDASRAFQKFQLRQSPLTYLAAATPAGAESTLQVRVDDVLWHEVDSLAGLEPVDRNYITATDDDSKTTVAFGNGEHGSRLPTAAENVRAVYRSGIGKMGNARARQISLLATRPLGVKSVINPLPATGGADRENRDQARRNVPLAVLALDRLVSVQDYADFARTFAGIGKARASKMTDGRRQVVFVTIAGAEDIPIDYHSDLYYNLLSALHKFGDPHLQIRVEVRELLLLVVSAKVRIKSDYLWDKVEPLIRAELLDRFSFERRDLGQDVLLSEVISAIQRVRGVDYVDVDVIAGIPEKKLDSGVRRILTPDEMVNEVRRILEEGTRPLPRIPVNLAGKEGGQFRPDQIAYLTPDVPDTLILTELKA